MTKQQSVFLGWIPQIGQSGDLWAAKQNQLHSSAKKSTTCPGILYIPTHNAQFNFICF